MNVLSQFVFRNDLFYRLGEQIYHELRLGRSLRIIMQVVASCVADVDVPELASCDAQGVQGIADSGGDLEPGSC